MTAAERLRALHSGPQPLVLVNVWDPASAKIVGALPGCQAIATASHAIAAAQGYPDGEVIPPEEMLRAVERIVEAVTLPVTADLESGYGDVDRTVRSAVAVGVVGANIEDGMRPLEESVTLMQAAITAADAEGVSLVLNARTDAFVLADQQPRTAVLADAIERGRRYLDVGATCVFVPGVADGETISALVDGIGRGKISVLGRPGGLSVAELSALGVARVSYGPWLYRAALSAAADVATALLGGAPLPSTVRPIV